MTLYSGKKCTIDLECKKCHYTWTAEGTECDGMADLVREQDAQCPNCEEWN